MTNSHMIISKGSNGRYENKTLISSCNPPWGYPDSERGDPESDVDNRFVEEVGPDGITSTVKL